MGPASAVPLNVKEDNMEIQSLSIVVPNKRCINDCAFCVSKMHCGTYKDEMDDNLLFFDVELFCIHGRRYII